jgi:hypothetical protein
MKTSSDSNSGSSIDLEPDPYREISTEMGCWDLSEIMSVPHRAECTDNSSSGVYFGGRRVKMEPASPDSFPEPRTFPTGWDLSVMETNQAASETAEGYSIDWMRITVNTTRIKPVDLDAAK